MESVVPPVVIKTEPVEAIDIESRTLELCQSSPAGISDAALKVALPTCSNEQRVCALNRLISQGKLEILKRGKDLYYKLKDPEIAKRVKGTDAEEKVVYQIIEKAQNKGIWTRDIRSKSSLSLTQVNKILKNLEGKKLIKSVKPVNASKKKVYMLYDLEPDRSVTGGAWYSDQEFETEFVEALNQQCLRFLQQARNTDESLDPLLARNMSYKSSKEVCQYINNLRISKVELSTQDIEAILNSLIYDGKAEKTVVSTNQGQIENLYRAKYSGLSCVGLMKIPCGACMLIDECQEGGAISPSNCEYMKEWLNNSF